MILSKIKLPLLIVMCLGVLSSCKVQLAPEYDKAIVDKVNTVSSSTMEFFAQLSDGVTKSSFSQREGTYNNLIGEFDALELQAKARPVPKNKVTEKINKLLEGKNSGTLSGDYPSAFAFKQISVTLVKMKDSDRANGIGPTAVKAFKGQIGIFLDQAITYESFLKR